MKIVYNALSNFSVVEKLELWCFSGYSLARCYRSLPASRSLSASQILRVPDRGYATPSTLLAPYLVRHAEIHSLQLSPLTSLSAINPTSFQSNLSTQLPRCYALCSRKGMIGRATHANIFDRILPRTPQDLARKFWGNAKGKGEIMSAHRDGEAGWHQISQPRKPTT